MTKLINSRDDSLFDRIGDILRPLGLTKYEIRVYLTLVKNGQANYRSLSREADVPIGRIYQVLSTLEAKGFVEVTQKKPKIFRAMEPKVALRRRLRQLEENYFNLERRIREVLPTLQLHYSFKHNNIQGVVSEILVGVNSFTKRIRETLLKAMNEVLIVTPQFDVELIEEAMFRRLLEKGVTVKAICSKFGKNSRDGIGRLLASGIKLRMQDVVADKYYVVDEKTSTTFINMEDGVCLQTYSSTLCRVLREAFEERWKRAREVQAEVF